MIDQEMEDIFTPGFLGDQDSKEYYLTSSKMQTFGQQKHSPSSYRNQRLQKDIVDFQRSFLSNENFDAYISPKKPSDSENKNQNEECLTAYIKQYPKGGGELPRSYRFKLYFNRDYPFKAPRIKFDKADDSQNFCFVDDMSSEVQCDLLKGDWNPVISLSVILLKLQYMIGSVPGNDDSVFRLIDKAYRNENKAKREASEEKKTTKKRKRNQY